MIWRKRFLSKHVKSRTAEVPGLQRFNQVCINDNITSTYIDETCPWLHLPEQCGIQKIFRGGRAGQDADHNPGGLQDFHKSVLAAEYLYAVDRLTAPTPAKHVITNGIQHARHYST